ncbi:hypothetical protein BDQ94DRAFT_141890 [Aspergillus welwitschiae]|uniref:Uncharacterized protein n=1 Tax=Aspergillus welwitschiae TaxID=1341132 RepID=A0A3F3Q4S1_9EURO|nr:hypothetical protein BDQ94DRAFT_141890 [Aspergillus welwitschiae]RDH34017.1 hypothetical protein BDQ94DRAFT_141890 [Aspergillus welwitschiae]
MGMRSQPEHRSGVGTKRENNHVDGSLGLRKPSNLRRLRPSRWAAWPASGLHMWWRLAPLQKPPNQGNGGKQWN